MITLQLYTWLCRTFTIMRCTYICDHIIITYTTTHKTSCLESCWDYEVNPVSVPSVSWSQFSALVAEVVQVGWLENRECEYAKLYLAFLPEKHVGKCFPRLETYIKANNWKATTQALKLSGLCLVQISNCCEAEQNVYGLLFPKCVIIWCSTYIVTYINNIHTTHTDTGKQTITKQFSDQLTCTWPENKQLARWIRQNVPVSNKSPK